MTQVLALVDCNHFYVSCERARRPELNGLPVGVLSNNDGCIIASSPELRALGISNGTPAHHLKALKHTHGLLLISPDFPYYGRVSKEIMATLREFSPVVEPYSIDEAFMDLTGFGPNPAAYARRMQQAVAAGVGVPVAIGIGHSKTLAKVATYWAKKSPKARGVLDLTRRDDWRELALKRLPIGEVWGIGQRIAARLARQGICTAYDLAQKDTRWAQKNYNVVFAKTVAELQGTPCFELAPKAERPKSLLFSRSFGQVITDLPVLEQATATYCRKICEKLRNKHMATQHVGVYVRSNRYQPDLAQAQYGDSAECSLPVASDITSEITQAALTLLRGLFRAGYTYYKVGIVLHGLVPAESIQMGIFDPQSARRPALSGLMRTVDGLNAKHGSGTVCYARENRQAQTWWLRSEAHAGSKTFDDRVLMSFEDEAFKFF